MGITGCCRCPAPHPGTPTSHPRVPTAVLLEACPAPPRPRRTPRAGSSHGSFSIPAPPAGPRAGGERGAQRGRPGGDTAPRDGGHGWRRERGLDRRPPGWRCPRPGFIQNWALRSGRWPGSGRLGGRSGSEAARQKLSPTMPGELIHPGTAQGAGVPQPSGAPRPPDRAQAGRPIASRSARGVQHPPPSENSLCGIRDGLPRPRGHSAPPAKRGPRAARQPRGHPLLPRWLAINSCRPRSCPGPAWPLPGGCCGLRELLPRS